MHVAIFFKTDTILPIRPFKEKTAMYDISEVVRMKKKKRMWFGCRKNVVGLPPLLELLFI